MKISFIGLGKLGCCMFASLAKYYDVIGIDKNPEIIKQLQKGIAPHPEKDLQEMLEFNKERITVTTDCKKISETDATFIMVPTPSDETGGFSSEYVEKAILEVGRNIPDKKEYHLVVVCSTLIPGAMEEKIRPVLERSSNRKIGERLGLCYNPEFMAIGNVMHDFNNPDFIIIGESDKKAGDMLGSIYGELLGYQEYHHMSLYNAELTKIANNAYITMKMSFANTIGEICEGMPTGNAEHVLDALGSDSRIGDKYLQSGLSYGGPCFPRDSRAFTYAANKYGIRAHLSEMTDVVNIEHINRTVSKILQILSKAGTNKISVLGLTYKPDTMIVEESAALKIVKKLISEGISVSSYDPGTKAGFPYLSKSVKECLVDAKVVFIATPWNEFEELKKEDFQIMKENPIVIDAWGIQNQLQFDKDIEYILLGKNLKS